MVTVEMSNRSDTVGVATGNNDNDEISRFESKRYVSSCEAYWRIAEYDIVKLKPSVLQLTVHLEDGQIVVYDNNMEAAQEALVAKEVIQLSAYFDANKECDIARSIQYEELPHKLLTTQV